MKLRRRIGSVFLAFAMALSLIPSVAVSALAADTPADNHYVTVNYDTGSYKRNITVNVYDENGNLVDTVSIDDAKLVAHTVTISLTDNYSSQYDIENVIKTDGEGSVTSESVSKDSCSFWTAGAEGSNVVVSVQLCPEFKKPAIEDGAIDAATIYYHVTQASLLKLLHDNGVDVTADTKITKQQAVRAHFVEPYNGVNTEWPFDGKPAGGNVLQYYWIDEGLTDVSDLGNPYNIRYIEITYQQGDGPEQTKKIYSDDLKYINVGRNTYEIESNKNQGEHIVIFYTERTTPDNGVWTPLNVRFVKTGQPVATTESDMPTADTYVDRDFVAWTQQHNGGLPVLYNTLVKDDMNVFPQYKLWTTDNPTEIRVMNNDDLLQKRVAELLGCSVDDIDWDSMKITVHGQDGIATNPNYGTPGGIHNDWNDDEDRDFYKVYNYRTGAEGTAYENEPIPVDEITSISVSVRKLGETDYEKSVEIEKGAFAGDFAISMGNLSGDWRVELYINAEGDYPENPGTDPEPTTPAITDFAKTLVGSVEDASNAGITETSTYTFPNEDNKVIIPYGEEVTLLYAITVTGEGGTEFTVTDEGAELVDVQGVTITEDADADTFTGTIPEEATEITFYVSKTFTADNLKEAADGTGTVLTNNASIISEDGVQEGEGEDGEETPAEEESYTVYTYVQFVKEGNTPLTDEEKAAIADKYGAALNDDNYLAIGTFEIPMPDPTESPYAPETQGGGGANFINEELWTNIQEYITTEYFKARDGIKNIDLTEINWVKLSTANGAENFTTDTNVCWHLDGQIQLYAPDISVDKALTEIQRGDTTISSTDITEGMTLEVGDQLTWTITVTNSGNAAATGLKLSDTLVAMDDKGNSTPRENVTVTLVTTSAGSVDSFTVPAATTTDGPGEVEFAATYTVQESDKGLTLKNTATVSDGDDDTEDPSGDTENPVAERKVEINKELTKVGETEYDGTSMVNVGDVLTYTITVTNTGNVALEDVTITDTLWKTGTMLNVNGTHDAAAVADGNKYTIREPIAVNDSVTITYTYEVQDTDAGKTIENTATVSNNDIDDGNGDTEEVTVANPAVDMTKVLASATRDGQPVYDSTTGSLENYKAQVGDVLTYTITVTNTGNTALTGVEVKDTMWGHLGDSVIVSGMENPDTDVSDEVCTVNVPVDSSVTITYTYTVQDSDVAAGEITNTAGVYLPDGDEPGEDPDDTDEVIVNVVEPDPDKPMPPVVDPDKPQLNTEDHYAYIVGYEDGTVRPEGDITRAEVATIFFRLLTDESRDEYWSQTNDYIDVAEGDWYNNAVSTLSKAGILNGYEDGSFQPNGNITRAEFATIAARFFEATYEGEDLFPDIEDHWARDYINQAAHAGIVNGYPNGTFQPQENITRAEAMTIVNRTLDRHPDADHFLADMITWPDNLESAWYYEQVQEATNSHEYIMKTDADKNPYEIWKEILPVRDWSELENTWSEAHAG